MQAAPFDELWERRQGLPYAEGIAIQTPDLDGLIATKRFGARPRDLDDIALLEALKERRR